MTKQTKKYYAHVTNERISVREAVTQRLLAPMTVVYELSEAQFNHLMGLPMDPSVRVAWVRQNCYRVQ